MIKIYDVNAGWFSAIMGTEALSIALAKYSLKAQFLINLSKVLGILGFLLYFLFLTLWILKIAFYPNKAKEELFNPSITHSHGMVGISAMLVASFLKEVLQLSFSFYLWIFGAVLTISFSLLVPYLLIISSKIEWAEVTPLWFIPPVGLLVIPMTCLPFLLSEGEVVRLLAIFGLSCGIMLYFSMFALFFGRALLHDPVCCRSLPTLWINLGPLAVGSSVMLSVSQYFPTVSGLLPLAYVFYFFGLWWLGILVMQTIHYKRKRSIPFGASWWAFIFPLSAFSIATFSISGEFPELIFLGYGVLLVALIVWGYVSLNYLRKVRSFMKYEQKKV